MNERVDAGVAGYRDRQCLQGNRIQYGDPGRIQRRMPYRHLQSAIRIGDRTGPRNLGSGAGRRRNRNQRNRRILELLDPLVVLDPSPVLRKNPHTLPRVHRASATDGKDAGRLILLVKGKRLLDRIGARFRLDFGKQIKDDVVILENLLHRGEYFRLYDDAVGNDKQLFDLPFLDDVLQLLVAPYSHVNPCRTVKGLDLCVHGCFSSK